MKSSEEAGAGEVAAGWWPDCELGELGEECLREEEGGLSDELAVARFAVAEIGADMMVPRECIDSW